MSDVPELIRDLLESARKRILPGDKMSFELLGEKQKHGGALIEFFRDNGFGCGGRFNEISATAKKWLEDQGVDLTKNLIQIKDKYR